MKQNDAKKTVIGITGGIGSGKSAVLAYIEKQCVCRVISADQVGRELMKPGKAVYRALVRRFGDRILRPDGTVDTAVLTAEAFRDPDGMDVLNAIEHPIIRKEVLKRIRRTVKPLVFVEAALLEEGGLVPVCDEVWVVTAGEETRVGRLMASRGYTEEKARAFINRQLTEAQFLALADRVIRNDGAFRETEKEADACLRAIGAVMKHAV
ncbi:MAG: dephospho-CoA kinase [Lachnospiraceae bacterium]|nr:dephospho-CoA kinase [Lachnospiraceae bacterium]MBP5254495.1 dephospho-CoA kinase [Lachnospiraceae bacterium]